MQAAPPPFLVPPTGERRSYTNGSSKARVLLEATGTADNNTRESYIIEQAKTSNSNDLIKKLPAKLSKRSNFDEIDEDLINQSINLHNVPNLVLSCSLQGLCVVDNDLIAHITNILKKMTQGNISNKFNLEQNPVKSRSLTRRPIGAANSRLLRLKNDKARKDASSTLNQTNAPKFDFELKREKMASMIKVVSFISSLKFMKDKVLSHRILLKEKNNLTRQGGNASGKLVANMKVLRLISAVKSAIIEKIVLINRTAKAASYKRRFSAVLIWKCWKNYRKHRFMKVFEDFVKKSLFISRFQKYCDSSDARLALSARAVKENEEMGDAFTKYFMIKAAMDEAESRVEKEDPSKFALSNPMLKEMKIKYFEPISSVDLDNSMDLEVNENVESIKCDKNSKLLIQRHNELSKLIGKNKKKDKNAANIKEREKSDKLEINHSILRLDRVTIDPIVKSRYGAYIDDFVANSKTLSLFKETTTTSNSTSSSECVNNNIISTDWFDLANVRLDIKISETQIPTSVEKALKYWSNLEEKDVVEIQMRRNIKGNQFKGLSNPILQYNA